MNVKAVWPDGTTSEHNIGRLKGVVRVSRTGGVTRPAYWLVEELPSPEVLKSVHLSAGYLKKLRQIKAFVDARLIEQLMQSYTH